MNMSNNKTMCLIAAIVAVIAGVVLPQCIESVNISNVIIIVSVGSTIISLLQYIKPTTKEDSSREEQRHTADRRSDINVLCVLIAIATMMFFVAYIVACTKYYREIAMGMLYSSAILFPIGCGGFVDIDSKWTKVFGTLMGLGLVLLLESFYVYGTWCCMH